MKNNINYHKWEFVSANIIKAELIENGYQGGDAGHGGFVTIKIKNISSTAMFLDGKPIEEFELTVKGDCERDTLSDALLVIASKLKNISLEQSDFDSIVNQIIDEA